MGHPVHHHCYQPHHNHLNLHHPHHHLINIFTTITRCSEDWFGLGWSEEKYDDFFSRGPLQLNMFKKSEETRKPGKQETTVNQVASKFEKMEVKNEAPKRPKNGNYKTQIFSGERNLENFGVKSNYTTNFYQYETSPAKVLVVGTSLTNQSLNVNTVEKETGVKIKMVRCYTVKEEDGQFKADENVERLLEDSISKFKPDIVTVESLVNEITNLDDRKSEDELVKEIKGKVQPLMKLLKREADAKPNLKIVMIKPLKRIDNEKKLKITEIVGEGLVKGARASRVQVRALAMGLETPMEEVMVFGAKGTQDKQGRQADGLHFRGIAGSEEFTVAYIGLLKSIL